MVEAYRETYWGCGKCDAVHETEAEANACCKIEVEEEVVEEEKND